LILKVKLDILGIDREILKSMFSKYTQTKLARLIDNAFSNLGLKTSRYIVLAQYPTTTGMLHKLRSEWIINLPPRDYFFIDTDGYLGDHNT